MPEKSGLEELIEGLSILSKYDKERSGWPTHCEHDILMVAAADTGDVAPEDRERLEELGFFWDDTAECWCSFRFGSC